jgi:hypothetical protein
MVMVNAGIASVAIFPPFAIFVLALIGVTSTITQPSVAAVARFDMVSTMQTVVATDPVCYWQPQY